MTTPGAAVARRGPQGSLTLGLGLLPAGHRPDDQERLRPVHDLVGKRIIHGFVGEVLLAGEEPDHGPPPLGDLIPDGPPQRRIGGLQGVEHRALGGGADDLDLHLAADPRQGPQVAGEDDSDHESVWTSTETTGGRSWTIAFQLSPASVDA